MRCDWLRFNLGQLCLVVEAHAYFVLVGLVDQPMEAEVWMGRKTWVGGEDAHEPDVDDEQIEEVSAGYGGFTGDSSS
jgi:hypothetical protein